jgi:hypothetical protein
LKLRVHLWQVLLAFAVVAGLLAWAGYRYRAITFGSRPYLLVKVNPEGSAVLRDGVFVARSPVLLRMPDAFFELADFPDRYPPRSHTLIRQNDREFLLFDGNKGIVLSFVDPSVLTSARSETDDSLRRQPSRVRQAGIKWEVNGGRPTLLVELATEPLGNPRQ